MPQNTAHSEVVIQNELRRLAEVALPTNVLDVAQDVGSTVVGLVHFYDTYNGRLEDIEARSYVSAEKTPSEVVLTAVEQQGKLTPRTVKVVKEASTGMLQLVKDYRVDANGTQISSTTTLGDYLLDACESRAGKPLVREARRSLKFDNKIRNFIEFCLSEQNEGAGVPFEAIETLVAAMPKLNAYRGSIDSIPEEQLLFAEDENLHTVKGLLMVDLFAAFRQLPAPKLTSYPQTNELLQEQELTTLVTLLEALESPAAFKTVVDEMVLKPFAKGLITKKLPPECEAIRHNMLQTCAAWAKISYYEAAQELWRSRVAEKKRTDIKSTMSVLDGLVTTLEEKQAQLAHGTEELIHAESGEQALGGTTLLKLLAVERFIITANTLASCEPLTEELVQHSPNHAIVNHFHSEQQLQELYEALQPLQNTLVYITNKYAIKAPQIRELEGGLPLRSTVEKILTQDGSRSLFSRQEAQQLAGLALLIKTGSIDFIAGFKQDLAVARAASDGLEFLEATHLQPSMLLSSIDTLSEVYETASDAQRASKDLAPLWHLLHVCSGDYEVGSQYEENTTAKNDVPEHVIESDQAEAPAHESTDPTDVEVHPALMILEHIDGFENIKAFPPEATAATLRQDFERALVGRTGDRVRWSRITELVALKESLVKQGFETRLLALKASEWHPLPHYVVEATRGEQVVAVIESPIHPNASYVIHNPEWKLIVQFNKNTAVRDFGARYEIHTPASTPEQHRNKLLEKVIVNLKK